MPRFACIWIENLAIQLLLREQPELRGRAIALYNTRQRIAQCNEQAMRAGVKVGMTLREATSLLGNLLLYPLPEEDPQQARRPVQRSVSAQKTWNSAKETTFPGTSPRVCLESLGERLLSLSPRVAPFPPEEVIVDLQPALHLFGSEEEMTLAIASAVVQDGWTGRIAVASSLAAARLGVRLLPPTPSRKEPVTITRLCDPAETEFVLSLPLERLSVLPEFLSACVTNRLLRYLGIHTLGDLRNTSPLRLAPVLPDKDQRILMYAQLSPALEKDLVFLRPLPPLQSEFSLSPPVVELSLLMHPLAEAVGKLMRELYFRRLLLCSLDLFLVTEEHDEIRKTVALARPSRDSRLLLDLCRLQLSHLSFPGPVAHCRVEVSRTTPETRSEADLLETTRRHASISLLDLASRIKAALGRLEPLFHMLPTGRLLPEEEFAPVEAKAPDKAKTGSYDEAMRSGKGRLGTPFGGAGRSFKFGSIPDEGGSFPALLLNVKSDPPDDCRTMNLCLAPLAAADFEYEFFDPVECRLIKHAYFRITRSGRVFLLKKCDGKVSLVGCYD